MSEEISLVDQVGNCHKILDELFLLHQECLLEGELEQALVVLRGFNTCHTLHMEYEDTLLLPAYAQLPNPGRWDATLYEKEHQKIIDLYTKLVNALVELEQQPPSGKQLRRTIIHFLDREKSFKGLCEHHQEREEASMLLELDTQKDLGWLLSEKKNFQNEWEKVYNQVMELIKTP